MKIFIFFLFFISSEVRALTCRYKAEFIIKCDSGICAEGFFASRTSTGNWCSTMLDVDKETKIYLFDGDLKQLKSEEKLNGFYSISIEDLPFLGKDPKLRYETSIKLNEKNQVSLISNSNEMKLTKLSYSDQENLKTVLEDYVQKTKHEHMVNQFWKWLLPVLMFVIFLLRARKPSLVLNIVFLAFAFFGIFSGIWGYSTWIYSGFIGAAIAAAFMLIKLYHYFMKFKKSED